MKHTLFAFAAALLSTQALAQTQFPPNTLWGNITASQGLPKTVPLPNCPSGALNFSPGVGFGCGAGGGGGGVVGPGPTVVDHLATWANTTGTQLKDSTWTPVLGVNTSGATNPGIFSVGTSATLTTANRVLFTVDDTANSVNGHWITSKIGTPGALYTMPSGGGASILYSLNANLGNNTGSFPFFFQQWFNTSVASGTGGGITGLFVQVVTSGAWTPGVTGNPGPIAIQTLAEADTGGFVFGLNPFARCKTTACTQIVGMEVDVDNQINATAQKIGIQVVDQSTGTGTVTADSAAYVAINNAGAGFKTGLQFGTSSGTLFPITTTGTIIKAYANTAGSTVAIGVDLTGSPNVLTVTGSAFKSTGFNVSGTGAVSVAGLTISTITGAGFQCLHANTTGVVSATGTDCGSGGGAVSSVSNADGSLTISPTAGAVVASLNVTHGNNWTAPQTITSTVTGGAGGTSVTVTQNQPNATDMLDGAMALNYTISASSATNELVTRVLRYNVTNNLTGGGVLSNARFMEMTINTNAGTTAGSVDGIYIQSGTAAGTVTQGAAIRIAGWQGTTKYGISDASGGFWLMGGAGSALITIPTTVASLPTCSAAIKGGRSFVTDATSVTFHAAPGGGGSSNIGVVCDGSSWYID